MVWVKHRLVRLAVFACAVTALEACQQSSAPAPQQSASTDTSSLTNTLTDTLSSTDTSTLTNSLTSTVTDTTTLTSGSLGTMTGTGIMATDISLLVNGSSVNVGVGQPVQWVFGARSNSLPAEQYVAFMVTANPQPPTMMINGNGTASVSVTWTPSSSDPSTGAVDVKIRDMTLCSSLSGGGLATGINTFTSTALNTLTSTGLNTLTSTALNTLTSTVYATSTAIGGIAANCQNFTTTSASYDTDRAFTWTNNGGSGSSLFTGQNGLETISLITSVIGMLSGGGGIAPQQQPIFTTGAPIGTTTALGTYPN